MILLRRNTSFGFNPYHNGSQHLAKCRTVKRLRLVLMVNIVLLIAEIQTNQVLLWPLNHMCARSNISLNNHTTLYNSIDQSYVDLDVIQAYLMDASAEDLFAVAKASSLGVWFDDVAHCTEYPMVGSDNESTSSAENITINIEGLEMCQNGLHFDELDPMLSVIGHFNLACQRQWIKVLFAQLVVVGAVSGILLTWILVHDTGLLSIWIMWNTVANAISVVCAATLRLSVASIESRIKLSLNIELIILLLNVAIRIMSHMSIILRCSYMANSETHATCKRPSDATFVSLACRLCSKCICKRGYLFKDAAMVVTVIVTIGKAAHTPILIRLFNHWAELNLALSAASLINWLAHLWALREFSACRNSISIGPATVERCSEDESRQESRDLSRDSALEGSMPIDFCDKITTTQSSTVRSNSCDESHRWTTEGSVADSDRVKLIGSDSNVNTDCDMLGEVQGWVESRAASTDRQSQDRYSLLLQIDSHDSCFRFADNTVTGTRKNNPGTASPGVTRQGLRQVDLNVDLCCLSTGNVRKSTYTDDDFGSQRVYPSASDDRGDNQLDGRPLEELLAADLVRCKSLRDDDNDVYGLTTISCNQTDLHHCCNDQLATDRPIDWSVINNKTDNEIDAIKDRMFSLDECAKACPQQQTIDQANVYEDLGRFRVKIKLRLLMFCLAFNYFLFSALPNHKLLHSESVESISDRKVSYRLANEHLNLAKGRSEHRIRVDHIVNDNKSSLMDSAITSVLPLTAQAQTFVEHQTVARKLQMDPYYEASDFASSNAINSSVDAHSIRLNNTTDTALGNSKGNNNNNNNKHYDSSQQPQTTTTTELFDYRSLDYARNIFRTMRESYNPIVVLKATSSLYDWPIELTVLSLHVNRLSKFDSIFFSRKRFFQIQKYGSALLIVEWLLFGLVRQQNHLLEVSWLKISATLVAKFTAALMLYGFLHLTLKLRRSTKLESLVDLRSTLTLASAAFGMAAFVPILVSRLCKDEKFKTRFTCP